jgi:O-antigen/teichoic acid export membrane protein
VIDAVTGKNRLQEERPPAGLLRLSARWQSWVHFAGEYVPTLMVEIGVMLSQLWVYRLASHLLGSEGFSEYAVSRRTVAFLYPLAMLGSIVALPRFIARKKHDPAGASAGYFGAALSCVLATTSIWILAANSFPGAVAKLFFGSAEFRALVFPLSLLTSALALHTVTYAYFRGHMEMKQANFLQFVNLALIPPVVLLVAHKDVQTVLRYLGISTLAVTGVAVFSLTPWSEIFAGVGSKRKELLRYGMQRVPGDLALLGLFALPTTVTAHARGVREAGLVAFATLAISVVSAAVNPLGLILLPKASGMFATGKTVELKHHLGRLVTVTVLLTGSVASVIGIFATPITRAYLGAGFVEAAGIIRMVALGIVPYCLFLLLSHVIDAFHKNSVTAGIELIAVTVAASGCWIAWAHGRTTAGFVIAFLSGVLTLGLLAIAASAAIFRGPVQRTGDEEIRQETLQPGWESCETSNSLCSGGTGQ